MSVWLMVVSERATPYMHRNKIFNFSTMATITKQTWYLLLFFLRFFFRFEDKTRAFYMHRWFRLSVCIYFVTAFCGRWDPYVVCTNRKQITLILCSSLALLYTALSHDHLFSHLCLHSKLPLNWFWLETEIKKIFASLLLLLFFFRATKNTTMTKHNMTPKKKNVQPTVFFSGKFQYRNAL